jgi:hypothetical protein
MRFTQVGYCTQQSKISFEKEKNKIKLALRQLNNVHISDISEEKAVVDKRDISTMVDSQPISTRAFSQLLAARLK